jgi:hypothetical protein
MKTRKRQVDEVTQGRNDALGTPSEAACEQHQRH